MRFSDLNASPLHYASIAYNICSIIFIWFNYQAARTHKKLYLQSAKHIEKAYFLSMIITIDSTLENKNAFRVSIIKLIFYHNNNKFNLEFEQQTSIKNNLSLHDVELWASNNYYVNKNN